MNQSFRIGQIMGITVRVHVIFLVLLGLLLLQAFYSMGAVSAAWFLLRFLLLFFFVVLHELGHCLAAQSLGVKVFDIVLWPLGGMARLAGVPTDPSAEFKIAIAGPLVNFLLVLLIYPIMLALGAALEVNQGVLFGRTTNLHQELVGLAQFSVTVNLLMGAVNLVPAFPLDGGRILRSILARKMTFVEATRAAVRVGRVFAVVCGGAALAYPRFISVAFIAIFIWWAGGQELRATLARESGPISQDPPGTGPRSPGAGRFLSLPQKKSGAKGLDLGGQLKRYLERMRGRGR